MRTDLWQNGNLCFPVEQISFDEQRNSLWSVVPVVGHV